MRLPGNESKVEAIARGPALSLTGVTSFVTMLRRNGEVDLQVHRLDEAIQSTVALTGEALLRCLKYLWPRSRRYELDPGRSLKIRRADPRDVGNIEARQD